MSSDQKSELNEEVTAITADDAADTVTASPAPEAAATPPPSWSRRTFLRAAALGAAVAGALLVDQDKRGRLHLGGAAAFADDLSGLQCTANDVRIIGQGVILNEPCDCPAGTTFDAQVAFTVENNAAAKRYCPTLHLCPVTINGTLFDPGNIVLADVLPGKSTQSYTVEIKDFPCNAGLVCFGERGPEEFGVFPKGAACPAGKCCSTITWNVNAHDPCPDTTRQIPSKCRHQQICIQGRGVSLTCVDDPEDDTDSCTPTCGGTSTLMLCVSGGTPPFTFALTADKNSAVIGDPTKSADGTCALFKVQTSETTKYTGTVTDDDGCEKSDDLTLTVTPISVELSVDGDTNCDGKLTFTADVQNGTGPFTIVFKVDGTQKQSGTGTTFAYGPVLDGICHRVTAEVSDDNGCSGTSNAINVKQCATTDTTCTPS